MQFVHSLLLLALLAGSADADQGFQAEPTCAAYEQGFVDGAHQVADVVLVNVLADPAYQPATRTFAARLRVLEILRGRSAPGVMDVRVDRSSAFWMRAGERWLVAVSGTAVPYVRECGIFAVKVEGENAIGRIFSIDANALPRQPDGRRLESDQTVPLERIRALLRDPGTMPAAK